MKLFQSLAVISCLFFVYPAVTYSATDPVVQSIPTTGIRFSGWNTEMDSAKIGDLESPSIHDVLINLDGSISKRPGYTIMGQLSPAPVEVFAYSKKDGTAYLMASCDSSVFYSPDGVNFTLLVDSLTPGLEMSFAVLNHATGANSLVFCNGTDTRYYWDGTTLKGMAGDTEVRPAYMAFLQDRLYGMTKTDNKLYYSPSGDGESLTTYNSLIVSFPSGEYCSGLSTLTRLADDITSYMTIYSPTTTWVLKNVATSITAGSLYPIFSEIGSVSPYALVNIQGLQIFPSKKGIYSFSGSALNEISQNIHSTYLDFGQVGTENYTWIITTTPDFCSGDTFINVDTKTNGCIKIATQNSINLDITSNTRVIDAGDTYYSALIYHNPWKAMDNDLSTNWIGTIMPNWVSVQFNDSYPVFGASFHSMAGANYLPIDFQIQALFNGVWVSEETVTGNTSADWYGTFNSTTCDSWRIYITKVKFMPFPRPTLYEFRLFMSDNDTAIYCSPIHNTGLDNPYYGVFNSSEVAQDGTIAYYVRASYSESQIENEGWANISNGNIISDAYYSYSYETSVTSTTDFLHGNTFTNINTGTSGQISYGGSFFWRDGWTFSNTTRFKVQTSLPASYNKYDGSYGIGGSTSAGIENKTFVAYVLSETNSVLCWETISFIATPAWERKIIQVDTFTGKAIRLELEATSSGHTECYYATGPLFVCTGESVSFWAKGGSGTSYLAIDAIRPETAVYAVKIHCPDRYFPSTFVFTATDSSAGGTITYFYATGDTSSMLDTATLTLIDSGTTVTTNDTWVLLVAYLCSDLTASLPIIYNLNITFNAVTYVPNERYVQWRGDMTVGNKNVSPEIDNVTIHYSNKQVAECSMQGIWYDDYVLFALAPADTYVNTALIAWNYKNQQWTQFTNWKVRRFTIFKGYLVFGSALNDGKIYHAWVGFNDNGDTIISSFYTKAFSFGVPYQKKKFRFLYTTAQTSDDTHSIRINGFADDARLTNYDTIPLYGTRHRKIHRGDFGGADFYYLQLQFYHDKLGEDFRIWDYQFGIESEWTLKDSW